MRKIQHWTPQEEDILRKLRAEGRSLKAIATIMGRNTTSIDHKVRALAVPAKVTVSDEIKTDTKQQGKDGRLLIQELIESLRKSPTKTITHISKLQKTGDTLVVHFTDWHVGKVTKDENGKEVYNTVIFKERINKLLEEILTLLDQYISKGTPIKEVVIISTGDILDGMGIYASQETKSELSPPSQVMLAVEVMQAFIEALLKRKLNINFYGVKGNHGEIREGGKSKDPNANWDLMLYLILDFWCKSILKNNSVFIHYSELDYLNFTMQGWRYHIRHIAPQQSETPAGKAKFLGWARKHQIDAVVYGHYHHWMIVDRSGITVFRGGSVCGQDDLSDLMAEESEPIQLIWGCSKNRPLSFAYPIDVGERKRK